LQRRSSKKVKTEIEINHLIEQVWTTLIDIKNRDWNLFTRLSSTFPALSTGVPGALHACFEGDDVWKQFDINFTEVDKKDIQILSLIRILRLRQIEIYNCRVSL
jgi:hypothetical protein